ncbi:PREDICTED: uncharacterized protein LOC104811831 isoform X2 [Tarenaya hassleriana]|uniref:uncharacterized protein LOC104811831 isoform X2 n=1 Tax=Tarenaya hassleriana TaxID=28532 RepID=UPI00053C83D3|nr:PREDICTED: uncharacterized protein LOC104811831 isoform X2 [Tarenaya hassleriana]
MCSRVEAEASPEEPLKLAIAVSLLRSRILNRLSSSRPGVPSEADAFRWKHKAKERKREIIRLREDLKETENASPCDFLPQTASCKCYFFDNLGDLNPRPIRGTSELRFNDVLRRRFLKLARAKCRRKTPRSSQRLRFSETKYKDEAEQDEPVGSILQETPNFSNWSHQAVDLILASLKNLLAAGNGTESVEESISYLITKLITRISSPLKAKEGIQPEKSFQFYVQHLVRKLGSQPYIGQRALLAVSQRISVLAESLFFVDPFDESFSEMHECLFTLIQLTEMLICEYLLPWSEELGFETAVLEEWVASVVHARKAMADLEDGNGLYVLYMDRVTGELAKRVGHISSSRELDSSILDKILASP